MRRGNTHIRQDAQTACAVREHVLERFAGVVGHSVGKHVQVAYSDALVAPEHMQVDRCFIGTDSARGAPAHVQRNGPFARQRQRAANVIRMLMRDENGIDLIRAHVEPREAPLDFLC